MTLASGLSPCPNRCRLRGLLLLVVCAAILLQTHGMLYTGKVKTSSRLYYLTHFGFQRGGLAKIGFSATPQGDHFGIFGCNPSQSSALNPVPMDQICAMMNTSTLPCSISLYRDGAGLTSEFTAEYSILAQERVYFYIANCDGDDAEVDYHLELINNHGNQLSTEYLRMPAEVSGVLAISTVMTIAVAAHWFYFRSQVSKLHRVISIFPPFKACFCVVSLLYWLEQQRKGYASVGLTSVYFLSFAATELLLFLIAIMAACGYGIEAPTLILERWPIFVTGGVAAGAFTLGAFVTSYFSIFAFMAWIMVLGLAIRSAGYNYYHANQYIQQPDHDEEVDEVVAILKTYKFGIIVYLVVLGIALLVDVVVLIYLQWIAQMLIDIIELSFYCFVAYLFRLRENGSYYKLRPHLMVLSSTSQFNAQQASAIAQAYGGATGGAANHQNNDEDEELDLVRRQRRPLPQRGQNQVDIDDEEDDEDDALDSTNSDAEQRPLPRHTQPVWNDDSEIVAEATFNPPDDDE